MNGLSLSTRGKISESGTPALVTKGYIDYSLIGRVIREVLRLTSRMGRRLLMKSRLWNN